MHHFLLTATGIVIFSGQYHPVSSSFNYCQLMEFTYICYVSTIQVGTQLNPDANVAVPSKGLPKWVIPVCVVSAVLLLVLIVFCLYKVSEQGITAFHILMIL